MRTAALVLSFGAALAAAGVCLHCSTSSGGSPAGDGGPASQNLCQNPSDLAARGAYYCPGNQSIDGLAATCGVGCAFTLDAGACTTDCLLDAAGGALSQGCASCFATMVVCARDNCLNECLGDPLGDVCLACRCGDNLPKHVNCYVATEQCSGVHRTECDQLEAGTWTGYPPGDAGCPAEAGGDAGVD
ncbi:MAG TPA: hypothetical protein VIF15_16050 [Polyangiaceae bacterium]